MTAACSFIHALAEKNPDEYAGCVPLAVNRLARVCTAWMWFLY